jgi:hypothetical protein
LLEDAPDHALEANEYKRALSLLDKIVIITQRNNRPQQTLKWHRNDKKLPIWQFFVESKTKFSDKKRQFLEFFFMKIINAIKLPSSPLKRPLMPLLTALFIAVVGKGIKNIAAAKLKIAEPIPAGIAFKKAVFIIFLQNKIYFPAAKAAFL